MACSDYQNECLKVVTIDYLRRFVDSQIQNSAGASVTISHSLGDSYCPTYKDLTGGTIVQNWKAGSTPISDQDGIIVNPIWAGGNGSQRYTDNQLVDQRDLSMMYTRFKSFSVSNSLAPNEKVGQCGNDVGLGFSHKYTRYTKSMNGSCTTSTSNTEVDDLALANVSWSETCDWVSVDGTNLTATVSSQPETRTAPERCCTLTGSVVFRTTSHSASTKICQTELTGGYTNYEGRHYTGVVAVAATSTSFGCCGGTYGITGTGSFYDRYEWVDTCNRIYHSSPYNDVTGTEAIGGGGGCTSCQISGENSIGLDGGTLQLTVAESTGGDYAKSGTFSSCDCCNDTSDCCDGCSDSDSLSLTYHGHTSNSVQFSQSCNSQSSGCYSPDPPGPDTGDTGTTGTCTTCPDDKCGTTAVNKWYQGVNGADDTSNPCSYIITVHWCTRYSCSQSGCPDCCKSPQGNDSWVVGKDKTSYIWTCPCNSDITTTVPAAPEGCD